MKRKVYLWTSPYCVIPFCRARDYLFLIFESTPKSILYRKFRKEIAKSENRKHLNINPLRSLRKSLRSLRLMNFDFS